MQVVVVVYVRIGLVAQGARSVGALGRFVMVTMVVDYMCVKKVMWIFFREFFAKFRKDLNGQCRNSRFK